MFGAVTSTKNISNINEYKYSGYGIGFDKKGTFSIGNGFGRNCKILWVDMISSAHVDNMKIYILLLGEGLNGAILTAEKNIQLTLLKIINFV